MTDAADRIERALERDPDRKGRMHEGLYIHVDLPLAVSYEVSSDDRLVEIVRVVRR